MAKATQEVATVAATALATAPNAVALFDGQETGYENVGARDLLVPRLTILQGLSPQIDPTKPEYDANARMGTIYDLGLAQSFPGGIHFLLAYYDKKWLEWGAKRGDGLQAIHDTDTILKETQPDEKGKPRLRNGHIIVETAQLYGLNMSAKGRKTFLPMVSTQLKKSRQLITWATNEMLERPDGSEFQAPLWYRAYSLSTTPESNDEGNWMGWKVQRGPELLDYPNWQDILASVKEFREMLMSGQASGDMSGMNDAGSSTKGEVPF